MAEKITKVSKEALNLIKKFEGFCAQPCSYQNGKPSIGYGSSYYEDGTSVNIADKAIDIQRADILLLKTIKVYESFVGQNVVSNINQNQFDALVVFSYNIGIGAFKKSTLLKTVNKQPNDNKIRDLFMEWKKANKIELKGLTKRRKIEADLYFK
jgi:lysozyme